MQNQQGAAVTATLVIGNYNYSSWSLRAWLVAEWSGLDFAVRQVQLDTDSFATEIHPLSPSGLVPVLHHDDIVIWDSFAIAEYLAERFAQACLWPTDFAERARARALAAEMHSGFASLRRQMPMNCRATGRNVPVDEGLARDCERIQQAWAEALQVSGGPCLFGRRCIADAMFAPVLFRFATYGVEMPEALKRYSEYMLALPELRTWHQRACDEKAVIAADEAG